MNKTLTKTLLILLSLALLLTLLTACATPQEPPLTDTATSDDPTAVMQSDEFIKIIDPATLFREERLDLALEADRLSMRGGTTVFVYLDGRIYYEQFSDMKDDKENVIAQRFEIWSVDTDGKDKQLAWSAEAPYEAAPMDENFEYTRLSAFTMDDDANIWVCFEYTTDEMSFSSVPFAMRTTTPLRFELAKYAPNGAILASCELPSEWELRGVMQIETDADGNAYLRTSTGTTIDDTRTRIHSFSAETAKHLSAYPEEQYILGMARASGGEVVYRSDKASGLAFVTLGANNKAEYTPYDIGNLGNAALLHRGVDEWDLLTDNWEINFNSDGSNVMAVYGYDIEESVKTLLIDFDASGIYVTGAAVRGLYKISDTEYLIGKTDDGIYKLTHDPSVAVSAEDKTIITVATTYTNTTLESRVRAFNADSNTVYVTIRDYSAYNTGEADYSGAMTQLDIDILNGNAPDMIDLTGIPSRKYVTKGILTELDAFLDGDANVKREDLFDSILKLGEVGGKLFHITPEFIPRSLAGKPSLFGDDGLTIEKISAVLDKHPNTLLLEDYSALNWLVNCIGYQLDGLVNWKNGTCDFDNADFVRLLKLADRFPSEVDLGDNLRLTGTDFDSYYEDYVKRIDRNETLLFFSILGDIRSVRAMLDLYGDDGAYLGFPSNKSVSGNTIAAFYTLGILETSEHKDEAWAFISSLIDADKTAQIGFMINKNDFEQKAAAEQMPIAERDWSKGLGMTRYAGFRSDFRYFLKVDEVNESLRASYPLTAAEVALMRDAIDNITTSYAGDSKIMSIVSEEVDAYINGARTAAETARIIQSRVGLYVAEQMG